jgi:hypothetical protein
MSVGLLWSSFSRTTRWFRHVGEQLDDSSCKPIALVFGISASPVILNCESQIWPEVKCKGNALLEV